MNDGNVKTYVMTRYENGIIISSPCTAREAGIIRTRIFRHDGVGHMHRTVDGNGWTVIDDIGRTDVVRVSTENGFGASSVG
jgi:hypothetical protein